MLNKIKIIAVGKIKEKYLQEGAQKYENLISAFCRLDVIEIKDEGIQKESKKIENYINGNTFILDSRGTHLTSIEFADFMKKQDNELTFVIGGSDGVTEDVRKKSRIISLSRMTFLHEMTRLILLEQIYRAFMIINNRKYHK